MKIMIIALYLFCVFLLLGQHIRGDDLDISKTPLNPLKKNKKDPQKDLRKCRVTHSGVEYEGNIAETKSGILCQNWETPDPIHDMAEQIGDADFPEGSKKKAKNYCRNPQYMSAKPWCYTLDFNIIEEECNVPLCIKERCRLTGPGVEYAGSVGFSGSRECLHWSELRGSEYKEITDDSLFPDRNTTAALNKCRNPDSDPGGPWCFVIPEHKKYTNSQYERAYCGIPFCEPRLCITVTTDVSSIYRDYHTIYTLMPLNTTSVDFSVKLWHPDQWKTGELKLALTIFPFPTTGTEMTLLKTGIEILISTYRSGMTPEGAEEPDWNVEPGLLSGTRWQDLELSWTGGFISLKIKGKSMSVFTKDYTENNTHIRWEEFQYFSIKGSNALWNFPFCSDNNKCEEFVTTHDDFERRWPFPKTTSGLELQFFLRGFHTAIIEMKAAAMLTYPSLQLTLANSKMENLTTLTLKESSEEERIKLHDVNIDSLLSYWEWREFLLNVDGPRLQLLSMKNSKYEIILTAFNPRIETIKWFSIGSKQSTIHWIISCSPPITKRKITAELPECVMNKGDREFKGFQSVSATGLTCLPWNDQTGAITEEIGDSDFIDGSKEKANNFCRNPSNSNDGPYCYAVDLSEFGFAVSKQYCFPRKCRSKECRMSGTGNDYTGSLNWTMSGRKCQRWADTSPHVIPDEVLRKELFPELSINNAANFCRNPTHSIAGPWCYTTDPNIETDICKVPDCDVPGGCKLVLKGNLSRQHIYILPHWRTKGLLFKVKSWDPKWQEGIAFKIGLSLNSSNFHLLLGHGNNDKIILSYKLSDGEEKVLKQKTVARVIPSGRWAGFQLIIGFGEITLLYANVPTPFFHWKHTFSEEVEPFNPKFLSYTPISDFHTLGIGFDCSECHIHITEPGPMENVYPLNWLKPQTDDDTTDPVTLSLSVRGVGTFIIVLINLFNVFPDSILIEVNDFRKLTVKKQNIIISQFLKEDFEIFNNNSWTILNIVLDNYHLLIARDNVTLVDYKANKSLLYYFFSLSVSDGILTWSVNCDPPNIDAPPMHGGWSSWGPWDCSVSCGGGHGKRWRICDSPKPNLFGDPCTGSDEMEGICNKFKCGDISPDLYDEIAKRATIKAHNVRKQVGEKLIVSCDHYIMKELKRTSPSTKVEWTKDGLPISTLQNVETVIIDQFVVERDNVSLNDSGIYMCALENRKGQRAIIQFTAVTVATTSITKTVREGGKILLDCKATLISYIFSDLSQFWTQDGKLFKDYGATSYSVMDIDILSPLNQSHAGYWECNVVQVQHNLTWVTRWFNLEVKESSIIALTFDELFLGTHFRPFGDDVVANSLSFLILLLIFIFFITCVIITLCSTKKKNSDYQPLASNEN